MAENKTQATGASVDAFLDGVAEERRADCRQLVALMERASGEAAKMWGPAIVGFGTYHYAYDSGREGDFLIVGFSPRKTSLTLYGLGLADATDALARLGKYKVSGSCLHLKKLADVNLAVLEEMVATAVAKHR